MSDKPYLVLKNNNTVNFSAELGETKFIVSPQTTINVIGKALLNREKVCLKGDESKVLVFNYKSYNSCLQYSKGWNHEDKALYR